MCTDEQHREKMTALARIEKELHTLIKGRPPIDFTLSISDTQVAKLSYHDRKHIFIWLPSTSLTFNFGPFGTCVVAPQVWVNLGLREGTDIQTSGQATPTLIYVRCTDEEIP